ncbi:hypothetical protein DFH08DRAFT_967694 [Mycena albidolilacea]|uniref:Uncharacterized protein n=1 Tax=Mycena albidolilacea TaxID=1033008 RepID=A0AAD7EIY1_9AGAR|nr:hypothetical protein DFH08DRAFT_967694 [Mycena albidolilacea]
MLLPPTNNARPGLLAFRNTCGRRGCGHVFEYDGADPLGNIHRLVREHSPLCGGLRAESSISFWRQPERPPPPPPPPVEEASFRSSSASSVGSGAGDTTRASSPSTATSASASLSTRPKRRTRARAPSATPSTASGSSLSSVSSSASRLGIDIDGSSTAKGKGKSKSPNGASKSSHTEPQRRALLAADPLIRPGSITPHTVGCAVCKKTIRLDRRSRYYPGLWVKHRVRCVKDQEEGKHGDGGERDPSVMDIEVEGMEVMREEEVLRPRRSCECFIFLATLSSIQSIALLLLHSRLAPLPRLSVLLLSLLPPVFSAPFLPPPFTDNLFSSQITKPTPNSLPLTHQPCVRVT